MINRFSRYRFTLVNVLRLTLRQLQIFTAVAEKGSTVAAASSVSLSQSATSSAVQELERLMSLRLFDRVGKRLMLNDSGRALLPRARAMLADAAEIERSGQDPQALVHEIKIGASTTLGNYVLPDILARLHRDRPRKGTAWQSRMTIGNTADICDRVARLELDIGFIEGPSHCSDVSVHRWLRDEMVLVSARANRSQHTPRRGAKMLDWLRQSVWLLREEGSGTREVTDQALLPRLGMYKRSIVLGSSEAIKRAAAEGLGIACLSRWVIEDFVRNRRLAIVGSPLTPIYRQCHWVVHREREFTPSLENLVALITQPGVVH